MLGIRTIIVEVGLNKSSKLKPRSISQLRDLEFDFYSTLNWRLNLLTPIEFSKMLLYYANPSFDFREITFKVNNFIYLCLLDEDIV